MHRLSQPILPILHCGQLNRYGPTGLYTLHITQYGSILSLPCLCCQLSTTSHSRYSSISLYVLPGPWFTTPVSLFSFPCPSFLLSKSRYIFMFISYFISVLYMYLSIPFPPLPPLSSALHCIPALHPATSYLPSLPKWTDLPIIQHRAHSLQPISEEAEAPLRTTALLLASRAFVSEHPDL